MMADVHALGKKQHILGDVGRVIGDALEVSRYQDQIDPLRNN
jgi:hypothetical protein